MARVHTHYDNLKVSRDAPPEVIRAAYRALCARYHPDRNADSDDHARVMRLLNAAYEVLADPARREEHDRWIADSESDEPAAPPRPGMQPVKRRPARAIGRHLLRNAHWYGLLLLGAAFVVALGYWLREQRNAPVLDSRMLAPPAATERADPAPRAH